MRNVHVRRPCLPTMRDGKHDSCGALTVCTDCGHEWAGARTESPDESAGLVVKDANGNDPT